MILYHSTAQHTKLWIPWHCVAQHSTPNHQNPKHGRSHVLRTLPNRSIEMPRQLSYVDLARLTPREVTVTALSCPPATSAGEVTADDRDIHGVRLSLTGSCPENGRPAAWLLLRFWWLKPAVKRQSARARARHRRKRNRSRSPLSRCHGAFGVLRATDWDRLEE